MDKNERNANINNGNGNKSNRIKNNVIRTCEKTLKTVRNKSKTEGKQK